MSKSANKILNTAEALFNLHSFTSVGVDLIRDESGCSKTTMYTYFKNKQQLVAQVLKQRDLKFRDNLTNFVGDSQGIIAIEKIYDWHMNWFQTDEFKGCLFVRAVAESEKSDLEIKKICIDHKNWLRELMLQYTYPISQDQILGEMIYNLIEGSISRFLVEGFDTQSAQQQKLFIIKLLEMNKCCYIKY